jgi:thiol-disulfide isomerase/thioredoxin
MVGHEGAFPMIRSLTLAVLLVAAPATREGDAGAGDGEPRDPTTGVVSLAGLRLPDLDGRSVELSSYLGKGPLVLDFWATWCKPCLAALPELERLHRDLGPRGLQVVGINQDGQRNAAKVKPFLRTRGLRFPQLLDLNREAQSRLNVAVLPTTILLDRDGRVVHVGAGFRPGETAVLREKIEALLDGGLAP